MVLRWQGYLTLLALILVSAPLCMAQTTSHKEGNAPHKQEQTAKKITPKQYLDILLARIAEDPANMKVNFEYATLARRLGMFDEAVSAYERMLIQQPDLHRVKLDLALTYMSMKDYANAEKLFHEVLDKNPPEQVQKNIQTMLSRLGAQKKNHKLTGALSFGYASQSNASAAPNSGNISVFDVIVPVGDGNGEDADENIFTSATLNHSYTFNHKKGYTWDSSASIYKTEQMSLDALDLTVFNYKTGPTYTLAKHNAKLRFEGAYSDIKLAHQDYLNVTSLQASVEKFIHPKVKTHFYAKAENRDFTNSRTTTTYEAKDGKARELGFSALIAATPQDIFNISALHRRESTQTLYNDNVQKSASVAYTRVLPKDMFFNTSLTMKQTQYKGVDVLVSPSTVRSDNNRTISALLGKKFKGNWTVSANYQHIESDSNIVNYEYENEKILLNATKQFSTTW